MGVMIKINVIASPAGRSNPKFRRMRLLRHLRAPRNDDYLYLNKLKLIFFVIALACGLCFSPLVWAADKVAHVIIISFDGLRPDTLTVLGRKGAPNFDQLMREGASTLNARTDPGWTVTMPNHTCMLTGRGVSGPQGHNYTDNKSLNGTVHDHKGRYVASVFDVAKMHGLSTGFFASKPKFQVFLNSYAESKGHRSMIDVHSVTDYDDALTLERLLKQMSVGLPALTFVHFSGPDRVGHHEGWGTAAYMTEVMRQDIYLAKIINAVRLNPKLSSTVVMITADHGGQGMNHGDPQQLLDYRVPLIIWGKGVARGADLYRINAGIRQDPKDQQVPYGNALQPIRNGDVANAALETLGLPLISGSTIGNPVPVRIAPVKDEQ